MFDRYMLSRRAVLRSIAVGVTTMAGTGIPNVYSQELPSRRESVTSVDGTKISYATLGSGPPIIFSHESLETGDNWLPVATKLANHFNCYTVDRRGHGRSGAVDNYSLFKECEDMQAVMERSGPDSTLMGASYGAIVAMETALRFKVDRLILYEPPLPLSRSSAIYLSLKNSLGKYRQYVEKNKLDEALAYGLKSFAGWTDETLAHFRQSSPEEWAKMRALTPSWVPELEAIQKLPDGLGRYRELRMPILLITGSESPRFLRDVVKSLDDLLHDSHLLVLQGQGHKAQLTAPGPLADGIAKFLES